MIVKKKKEMIVKKKKMIVKKKKKMIVKKEDDNSKKKKTMTYKIKFIDSYRFMQSKLSDLVDNLSGIYDKECKSCMERKKIKSECEFIGFKTKRLNYKCKEYGKKMH